MTDDILLRVENLTKKFPISGGLLGRTVANVHALSDVSLTMRKGQTLGVVGESGCGKSTLGRTILRLHEPTSGKIFFEGAEITGMDKVQLRSIRRQMQIIFQDPYSSLNPRMTVRAIISEPFKIHQTVAPGKIDGEVERLSEIVGLRKDTLDRYPHEFSGGQRQRIGIARALALNPKLIVADEPVSALDVSIQSQILNLMVRLRSEFGLSYLFISHDLAVIEHISDVVAVMYLGRIVEYTTAENLYLEPRHPYTRALISSIPRPDLEHSSKRQVLEGDVPSPITPPSGCAFHPRCPAASEKCKQDHPLLRNLVEGKKDAHWVACHNA